MREYNKRITKLPLKTLENRIYEWIAKLSIRFLGITSKRTKIETWLYYRKKKKQEKLSLSL